MPGRSPFDPGGAPAVSYELTGLIEAGYKMCILFRQIGRGSYLPPILSEDLMDDMIDICRRGEKTCRGILDHA